MDNGLTGKRILVLGCSGSGKSTFAARLHGLTGLNLIHLDNIWWRADRTHISREEFDRELAAVLQGGEWIIDGDYSRTYEPRLRAADTVFFLDYPLKVCLRGITERVGKARTDIPWTEQALDPELVELVKGYSAVQRPALLELFRRYPGKRLIVFTSREEADAWLAAAETEKQRTMHKLKGDIHMENRPVFNAILARRSIRQFQDRPVSREIVRTLLEAAMAAPSACNLQPWEFIVIDDPEVLKQLHETAAPGSYGAPLAIVLCGTAEHIPWKGDGWQFDLGAAAQNLMLECVEQGLASVCEGAFRMKALKALLDIPEAVQPVAIVEIGYPAAERIPYTWYNEQAVSWQKYDREKERVMRTVDMLKADRASGLC